MPDFRPPLTAEAVTKMRSSRSPRIDLTPYKNYIETIPNGGAGSVGVSSGESKPTIKRRITMAATQLGRKPTYLRSSAEELVFTLSSN